METGGAGAVVTRFLSILPDINLGRLRAPHVRTQPSQIAGEEYSRWVEAGGRRREAGELRTDDVDDNVPVSVNDGRYPLEA
jgi:hypothetical protein